MRYIINALRILLIQTTSTPQSREVQEIFSKEPDRPVGPQSVAVVVDGFGSEN